MGLEAKMTKIALFDTDGTLLQMDTLVVKALGDSTVKHVFRRFKKDDLRPEQYSGVTMHELIINWLRHTLSLNEARLTEYIKPILDDYEINLVGLLKTQKKGEKYVLSGVSEFLTCLKNRNVLLGVYSGATAQVHQAALRATSLDKCFQSRVSGNDDDIKTRLDMIRYSVEILAGRKKRSHQDVLVFGDTPSDIQAAKEYGAISIAVVKFSQYKWDDLKPYQPDFMINTFNDAETLEKVLEFC